MAEKRNISSISIIVPAYNEEERIGSTLKRIAEYFAQSDLEWELIVVDDGSTDNTCAVARDCIAEDRLVMINNEGNCGKGLSVKRGMLRGKGDVLLFSDADLSTPIEEFNKLLQCIREGYDIAIGSRGLHESDIAKRQPLYRQTMGKAFNFFVRHLAVSEFKDTQCGFKLFTRTAAQEIFPLQKVEGWAFDVEVLLLAKKRGYKIAEVPIRWINSPSSKVHPVFDSARMLLDLMKLRFRHFR